MAYAPSVENYTLGKGRLFFNKHDSTGALTGEKSLGNAPALTFSMAVEKLDHYSSQSGLRAKDKSVVVEVTPTLNFTLDEVNVNNLEMLFYGSSVAASQILGESLDTAITTSSTQGLYYETSKRNIGIYKLVYTNVAGGPFTDALASEESITGGTSTDTATVAYDDTANNTLYLTACVDGDFEVAEEITGGTSAATADVVSVATFTAGQIVAFDATKTTIYSAADYIVNSHGGLVGIAEGGTIADETAVSIAYAWEGSTYKVVTGLTSTALEGKVRFVSDNAEGPQMELRAWKVSLSPDGDTAFIGDDWSTVAFTGEILKDEANHPTAPYLELLI